ncbi:MAG TPA: hypothetical protein VGO25_13100, partial [Rhodanobacteraceae bacterium]|nr:hypothetical protein [Rhodanobacteraceae bacterium]
MLVVLSLAIGACNRPPPSVPQVQGKKPVAAEAPPKTEKPQGFALSSTRAEPFQGQLALTLEFTQPMVGTQGFDTLISVTGPKDENVQGSWALDDNG